MTQYREEVVRTTVAPADRVEERVVEADETETRTVRTTTGFAPPAVSVTEYASAPSYTLDRGLGRFLRISWFLLGLLEAMLALRFLLSLLGANERNEFAAAVYGLTGPFVAPFRTLFGAPASAGAVFELHTLVAMLVIFLVWWAAVKTIGVVLDRSVEV
jgi:uncharacterized protein YggT (Ycf19 family)